MLNENLRTNARHTAFDEILINQEKIKQDINIQSKLDLLKVDVFVKKYLEEYEPTTQLFCLIERYRVIVINFFKDCFKFLGLKSSKMLALEQFKIIGLNQNEARTILDLIQGDYNKKINDLIYNKNKTVVPSNTVLENPTSAVKSAIENLQPSSKMITQIDKTFPIDSNDSLVMYPSVSSEEEKKPDWVAKLDLCWDDSRLVGNLDGMSLYLKKMKNKDGSALSLSPKDVLIRFSMMPVNSNSSFFGDVIMDDSIWLPAKLFSFSSQDEKPLYVMYENELVAFKVNQLNEEILQSLVQSAQEPLFGIPDPWYLPNRYGSVYQFKETNNRMMLEELDKNKFNWCEEYRETNGRWIASGEKEKLAINFAGFESSDLKLVINEDFIVIRGSSHHPLLLNIPGFPPHAVFKFEWRNSYLGKLSIQEMKQRLSSGLIKINRGLLTIEF